MKANPLIEALPILPGIFYKNKEIVHTQLPNKRMEKRYYEISKDGKILVNNPKSKEAVLNPTILGSQTVFDAETKKMVLMWREGEKYAYPSFSEKFVSQKIISSEYDFQIWDAATQFKNLNDPMVELNRNEGVILMLVLACAVIGFLNLILTYMFAESMGFKLL